MSFTYEYPRPAVTVDAAVLRQTSRGWEIVLVKRGKEPFLGKWALPGGFVNMDETLEQAVVRELEEETGLNGIQLSQLHTFSAVKRDPRHRTITTVFRGIIDAPFPVLTAGDDAAETGWFPVNDLPDLAFDHAEVIRLALERLA